MSSITVKIKKMGKILLKNIPFTRNLLWGNTLYSYYRNVSNTSKKNFLIRNRKNFFVQIKKKNKIKQCIALISKVDIMPQQNTKFFYSIDPYKTLELQKHILDNCSIDYSYVVQSYFAKETLENQSYMELVEAMREYLHRCECDERVARKYKTALSVVVKQICNTF